ncbi:MAG TPA: Fic family protein [Gammaproteobacteria bacterium]|nr:Fic family protein [Gammaproteobacteria bacterium]
MEKTAGSLPEIVFDTDTSFTPDAVEELVRRGQLRKLGPKLYTSNLDEPPEAIVGRNIFAIAGHFWPGAVVGWRTAFEQAPSPDGCVYLSYHGTRKVSLPGHTLKLINAPGPLAGDRPFTHDLHLASPARAFLENLAASRHRKDAPRALPADALQAYLRGITDPADRERLRSRARELAAQFDWHEEFRLLEDLLDNVCAPDGSGVRAAWTRFRGVTQHTKKVRSSLSQVGALARRATAEPDAAKGDADAGCDRERLQLFQNLFRVLRERKYIGRPRGEHAPGWHINRAFFEAYFSNYLAGLEFDVDAAHEVIVDERPLAERPMDSAVLLNTFRLVETGNDLGRRPVSGDDFLTLLTRRHQVLFAERDDQPAGRFRQPGEQTDITRFIAAEHIRPTLLRGYELYRELQEPFTRAAFMLFLVRECHPFDSGSGRIARVMMNAELSAADQMRVLIPPVYCGDYWLALRALTRQNDPEPFVRMLVRAHALSGAIDFSSYQAALKQLEDSNALMQPDKRIRMHEV